MTFDDLIRITRRRWWLVLLVALAGIVAGYLYEATKPQTYEATGRVVIGPALDVEGSIIESTGSLTRGTLPQTLAEVVTGSEVRRAAERRLDDPTGAGYEVDAVVVPETSVVEVDVVGPDREVTVELAAALLRETESLFEGLYPIFDVVLLDEPNAPESPIAPDPMFGAVMGGVVGTALGLVLAAWLGRRQERRNDDDDDEPAGTLGDGDGVRPSEVPPGPVDADAQPIEHQVAAARRPRQREPLARPSHRADAGQAPIWERESWATAWMSAHRTADVDDPFEIVDDSTGEPSWLRDTEGGPRFSTA